MQPNIVAFSPFLICICSGEVVHSWSLPEGLSEDSRRLNITTHTCGRNRRQFCSRLSLNRAQANDTGYYSCKYPSSSTARKKTASTIYIFINGKFPFLFKASDFTECPFAIAKKEKGDI